MARRLSEHIFRFDRCATVIDSWVAKAVVEFVDDRSSFDGLMMSAIVKLHDSWAYACRQIVLSSASGDWITRKNLRLNRGSAVPTREDPLTTLRASWTKTGKPMDPNWEPHWFVPDTAIRAATLLGARNLTEITNAFGAVQSAEPLRITRNVVAHSLPNTWQRFRTLQRGLPVQQSSSPTEFVFSRVGNQPRLIEWWASELRAGLMAATI